MDGKGSLPGRHEIPDEFKWRLEDIYPSNEEWKRLSTDQAMVSEVETFRGGWACRPEPCWKRWNWTPVCGN